MLNHALINFSLYKNRLYFLFPISAKQPAFVFVIFLFFLLKQKQIPLRFGVAFVVGYCHGSFSTVHYLLKASVTDIQHYQIKQ